jgi:hypothetical protein
VTGVVLLATVFLPLLVAVVAWRWGSTDRPARAERTVRTIVVAAAAGAVGAVVVFAVTAFGDSDPSAVVERADGTASFGFSADRAAAIVVLLVNGVGLVVQSFAGRALRGDPRAVRFAVLAAALTTATASFATAATATLAVVAWVLAGTVLASLVAHRHELPAALRASRRTRLTFAVGDGILVAGLLLVLATQGDIDLRTAPTIDDGTVATIFAVALVAAGLSRSAIIPAHRWLAATLAAPTAVSALLHAGVVNGAGVLFIQFAPIFGGSPLATHLAFALGVLTAVVATGVMLVRADTKGALAWSTVGQMGFMVVQCAVGAFGAALFHLLGHGMYKAGLFLGAGGAITGHQRERERSHAAVRPVTWTLRLLGGLAPVLGLALAYAALAPDLPTTESMLVVVFAWAMVTRASVSFLRRGSMTAPRVLSTMAVGAAVAFSYVAVIAGFDRFVSADIAKNAPDVVGPWLLGVVLAALAVGAVVFTSMPGPAGDRLRLAAHVRLVAVGSPLPRRLPELPRRDGARASVAVTESPTIVADVSRAASVVAPMWPLTGFVAVNPLGGFQNLGFDGATARMRELSGAATHLTLDAYRRLHREGRIDRSDLVAAVVEEIPEVSFIDDLRVGGSTTSAIDVIVQDLLTGPDIADQHPPVTAGMRRAGAAGPDLAEAIDAVLTSWLALYVDEATASWTMPDRDRGFYAAWRAVAVHDPRVGRLAPTEGWVASLPADAARALSAALASLGVMPDGTVAELRQQVLRVPGYAGYARWRDEWAPAGHPAPPLHLVDILAVRCSLEAAATAGLADDTSRPSDTVGDALSGHATARVDAVVAAIAPAERTATDDERAAIASVLSLVEGAARNGLWLAAHERRVRGQVLTKLERVEPATPSARPELQAVFCIDVRSELMRRHLEAVRDCDTVGFAGFFGIPITWTASGSPWTEPRCPVLVTPVHSAAEHARPGDHTAVELAERRRRTQQAVEVFHDTKGSESGPFVLAELGGFVAGPVAAARTLAPPSLFDRPAPQPVTDVVLGDGAMTLDERALFGEAMLRTMGVTRRIGRLVLLCGHGADTTNNPHASSLDCGACGGAHGGPNARVAAQILNDPEVRSRLSGVGIDVPSDAVFVAGEHDTVSDQVTIFDRHLVPDSHRRLLADLETALAAAGRAVAAERARKLPGDPAKVASRGFDWAEVRPEWGLAGNAAFVIAPRSTTSGIDLGGRTFLHSYDALADDEGLALETIMTAPLVVAQWISSQYYFSTVDMDRFGAGDKVLHNPVGGIGVVTGDGGDLRVGLPEQSVSIGGEPIHEPVRLLAVIEAPLERIEMIIQRNQILRELIGGRWITVAGRSGQHDEWSIRTPAGTWATWTPSEAFSPSTFRDAPVEPVDVPSPAVRDDRVEVG